MTKAFLEIPESGDSPLGRFVIMGWPALFGGDLCYGRLGQKGKERTNVDCYSWD